MLRCAPPAWRVPSTISLSSLVHAACEDKSSNLWFAATHSLVELRAGEWRQHSWPEGFEPAFRAGDSIFELTDGRLLIGAAEHELIFDPENEAFRPLEETGGRRAVKGLGPLSHA